MASGVSAAGADQGARLWRGSLTLCPLSAFLARLSNPEAEVWLLVCPRAPWQQFLGTATCAVWGPVKKGEHAALFCAPCKEREPAMKGTRCSRSQSPNPPHWEHLESSQDARLTSPSEMCGRGSAWLSASAFGTLTCGGPSITAAQEAAQGLGVLAQGRLCWYPPSPLTALTSPAPRQPGSSFTFTAWPIPLTSQLPLITMASTSSPLCFY